MDTSKKYIEMCRMATEIQDIWSPSPGDTYTNYPYGRANVWEGHIRRQRIESHYWLPRQDQLQEMLYGMIPLIPYMIINKLESTISTAFRYKPYWTDLGSMEQLWLAYYMYEGYNKVWGKEEEMWKTVDLRIG